MVARKQQGAAVVAVPTARGGTDEIGASGLVRYGVDVSEEWHSALQGRQGVRVLREMRDNCSTIGSSLYVMDSMVRQVPWRVEPAPAPPQAEDAAAHLESCIGDMSHTFTDLLSEVFSCAWFGWSYFVCCVSV